MPASDTGWVPSSPPTHSLHLWEGDLCEEDAVVPELLVLGHEATQGGHGHDHQEGKELRGG